MSDPWGAPVSAPAAAPASESGGPARPVAAIILAAGKSTRMRSKRPKPLHPLCGLPMTAHVLRACRAAGVERIVVVIGHEAETVRAGLGEDVEYALQAQQRGTGDAARAAQPLLADWPGTILILAGDVPLLPATTLQRLIAHHHRTGAAATLLTAFLEDPTGYGRVIRDASGGVARIVEERDASAEERAIKEWFPSLYAFESPALWFALAGVRAENAQGEYYLTDTVGLLVGQGARVEAIPAEETADVLGVNTRVELAAAAAILRQRLLTRLMLSGVTITDPATAYVEVDVEVGQDTVIEPNTFLLNGTRIGEDCVIGPFARIEKSTLGNGVRVLASQVVESVLEDGVKVGPFANLRPGTHLGRNVKIGDFVELKNARLGEGAQASHLAYIGDAEVGEKTNIGAGTITCNYDGYAKHKTVIGKNAFIGSHSTLIAPVSIGDGAFVAAASPIAADVPPDALAIARERPTIKEGWAARRRAERGAQAPAKDKQG
ncbi:MAG TPA: bifunctional UDP-N-acetylglucosamine diphosphorylase/glucosamine-1-phosphate N-acetyltransferase GlmU [Chthonomonadaceae bacterium]|nr:bifunctional UDP-N-acetylglucosamine diphosphorylase/glucosamine-1-phosphate N-acetyltransferase GlmU [Chthonomonadaceae bacterium]